MAERLVAKALTKTLRLYVKGYQAEWLKDWQLEDVLVRRFARADGWGPASSPCRLQLNEHVLQEMFNIPPFFRITEAKVDRLKISVRSVTARSTVHTTPVYAGDLPGTVEATEAHAAGDCDWPPRD